jgi:hypothetical protein
MPGSTLVFSGKNVPGKMSGKGNFSVLLIGQSQILIGQLSQLSDSDWSAFAAFRF